MNKSLCTIKDINIYKEYEYRTRFIELIKIINKTKRLFTLALSWAIAGQFFGVTQCGPRARLYKRCVSQTHGHNHTTHGTDTTQSSKRYTFVILQCNKCTFYADKNYVKVKRFKSAA